MLRLLLGLIVGIVLSEHLALPIWIPIILLSVSAILAFGSWRTKPRLFTAALWLLFTSLGTLVALRAQPCDPFPDATPRQLIVQLRHTPRRTPKCYKAQADILASRDSLGWHSCQGKILLYIQQDSLSATLRYGSRLWLQTQPRKPDTALNPYQFDYRRHLRRKGILYQCYIPAGCWHILSAPPPRGLRYRAQQIQLALLARLRATTLTPQHQGLVAALALGWRDDLSPDTQLRFRQAGITHLLCVSGLHVGIVALLVGGLLSFLGCTPHGRRIKGLLQLLAVWSFTLISGLAPATLRAAIMFSLLIVSRSLGRQYSTANTLCASALILLLVRPPLVFDVGFQLSYAAMTGIILWQEPLQQLVPVYNKEGRTTLARLFLHRLWGWATLSLSAQLATLPFTLYYFHQFPAYFLIANLLIVPFMEIILGTAFLAILFGGGAATLLQTLLDAIDSLTAWVAARPHALIQDIYCDLPLAFIIFAGLIFLTLLIRRRQRWALPAALLCLLAATAYTAHIDALAGRQHSVMLYNTGRHFAVECFDGRHSYLVCDDSVARRPDIIDYQRRGYLLHQRVNATTVLPIDTSFFDGRCAVKGHCILFDGRRLLVIDSANAGVFRSLREGAACGDVVPGRHFDAVIVAPQIRLDPSLLGAGVECDTLLCRYACTAL